ncbi:hypothetical protein GTP38_24945 [Duganella sp. FT94W]|uniref:Tyrosine-type recombinase/integrase n=1 Tax=Duganella lactea TaxID=2692173 RepID=A0ABW9VDN7_9BURK|nr:hypothetical protein [Duganella lactea]MYM37578.1 hypothetical protein [Duganella lactea]
MQIKAPRLFVNRHGVYYFRIKADGKEKRISLRTKCSNNANIIALQLNLAVERKRAMSNPKLSDFDFSSIDRYEISLPNGMKIKTDGSQADHDRAMEALEKIGPIPLSVQLKRAAEEEIQKSESLVSVVDKWLANCAGKNADRTLITKNYHIKNFLNKMLRQVASVDQWLAEHESTDYEKKRGLRLVADRKAKKAHESDDIEINALTKKLLTDYKSRLGSGVKPQAAKTIDNKLDSLADLMTYAIGHGLYTTSKDNPVDGLRIQTKKARIANTKSYQPFTRDALKILFDPKAYLERMNKPDLFWGPLLGVYSGMRISEATQIRCKDVYFSDNGVHYIHVYRSKSPGGIRNVPIAQALIDLGFLQYVEECNQAGAKRLFPNCQYINFSYYKKLSAALLEHQRKLSIKFEQTSFHSFRVNVMRRKIELASDGACKNFCVKRGHEIIPKGMLHDRHDDHQETAQKERAVSIPS